MDSYELLLREGQAELAAALPQGTTQHRLYRNGRFTGGIIHNFCENLKSKREAFTDTEEAIILQKAEEKLTGENLDEEINSKYLTHGIRFESEGILKLSQAINEEIEPVGFLFWEKHKDNAGCSPDGISKVRRRPAELKCPYTRRAHREHRLVRCSTDLKRINFKYWCQTQKEALCADSDGTYFGSYYRTPVGYNDIPIGPHYEHLTWAFIERDPAFETMLEPRLIRAFEKRDEYVEILKANPGINFIHKINQNEK